MAKSSDVIYIPDGSFSWAGGVDSSLVTTVQSALNPQGLPRNALAWLNNATVRGGGITQRTGFQPLLRLISSGKWQMGMIYEPDGANPYLLCQVSGVLYSALLEPPYTITDLTLGDPLLLNPVESEMAFFVQGEDFAVIQAGDYYFYANDADRTLPLIWNGFFLRRSIGITTNAAPAMAPGINEIPAATSMWYHGSRIWYALGRGVAAGDIAGGRSGTAFYRFRDSILSVTENPLCFGGDGFTLPTTAGNIRALREEVNLNESVAQSRLLIWTRKSVFALSVPATRTDWINADSSNGPSIVPVQRESGSVGDMCVVASNGDWFYQSFEPAVRSLLTAVRNFGQWGNTPISQNELRALAQNNRALMRFSSGINFDNRLLMAVLPQVASDGINVIHRAMLPLDFDVVSNLSTVGPTDVSGTSAMTPPVWEGALDGLNILQLFSGDFGGLPRAFATVISDVDGSINVWEITNSNRFENGDNRVLWSPEFPAFTWVTAGLEFKLKQLKGGELWVDKVAGRVDIEVYYRTDADPCWRRWFITDLCSARCEDYDSPTAAYPCEPFREGYKWPIVFPEPPPRSCDSMGVRPTTIGYQFQTKIMVRGWCRIRGLILYAIPHTDPQYHGIACPTSIPQGMAQLPRLIPSPFVPNVMSQFPPATLPPVPNADFTPPAPTPPTPGKNPPKQPINPTPLNGAVDVLNPILSWSDGGGATSYDVWFNGAFIGNQPGTTYNPGPLANSTPFTWRIDAVNADGTTTGVTWGFTTGVVVAFSYANPSLVINWVDSGGANSGTLAEFNILADQPTVTSLVFPASASITSITGLSSLPALTSITAAAGNIASLDLSGNPAIQTVDCHNDNSLTSLNLAGCVHLTTLQCGSCNGLTALDVHTCTALVVLSCNNCTTLAALNVTGLTALTTLNCWTTALVTLDVHTCTGLVTLDCHGTATLTALLVVGCTSLVTLDCHSCALPDLHCDNLTALATLDCSHNSIAIAGFHITGCSALSNLNCSFNPLTSLDVSAFSLLATLLCTNDSIGPGGLNITGLANLVTLACQANNVGSLDVTASAATLQYLDCFGSGGNNIGTLNITGCTQLIAINCFSNTIGPLDFTGFTNLISVDCHFCPNVTMVTLTGCTALQNFQGYGSGLTALDVSTFAALTNVTCSAAALTTLNVTGCTALQILLLNGNPALTVLTGIGTCSALITLNAGSTGLTGTLDVSGFIHLTQLFMVNASTLATLDCHGCTVLNNLIITGCTGLTTLDCYSNPAIAGITGLTDCTALATFNCNTSGLTGFDNRVLGVPALTKLATIDVHNCTALAAFIVEGPFTGIGTTAINITGCSNLTAFYAVSWSLATFDISTCPLITTLNVGSNALTLVAVNTALFDLDSAGLINGHCYIALQTPARVPDAGPPDGATAKANLTGKGWAVTTD